MEHLIRGVRDAVSQRCWYSALALSLTLPDTCGWIESPKQKNGKRSIAWFNANAAGYFRSTAGEQFLSGEEYWALRNSILHQGSFDVDDDTPTDLLSVLNKIELYISNLDILAARGMAAGVTKETAYHIMVAEFCENICKAVDNWLPKARATPDCATRLDELARINVWTFGEDGMKVTALL